MYKIEQLTKSESYKDKMILSCGLHVSSIMVSLNIDSVEIGTLLFSYVMIDEEVRELVLKKSKEKLGEINDKNNSRTDSACLKKSI